MSFVYIVEAPIHDKNSRGDVKVIPVKTVLSEKEYRALPSDYARAKCRAEVKAQAPRIRFTNAELDLAIELYLKYTKGEGTVVHNEEAIAEVLSFNPSRSSASVNMLFCQIRALDTFVSQEGFSSQSKALVRKLYEVDPERFPAGEKFEVKSEALLDSLLASIRG